MRTGADAGVVAITPIGQIMPCLRIRARVIGNLIDRKPKFSRDLLCYFIHVRRQFVVRQNHLTRLMQRFEWRALFDGKLVERQMISGKTDSVPQLRLPCSRRLFWAGIDQIERHALKCAARQVDGLQGFINAMQASQRLQICIV